MSNLAIYLQDHYAGSTMGLELAKRTARNNQSEAEFGAPLARVAIEIDEDRDELKRIMGRLDVDEARVKATLAWGMEKVGRLKPNGAFLRYSPLSRIVELEGLITGVSGKLSLWRSLIELAPNDARLDEDSLTRLAERAEDQLLRLHALRGAAALVAFGHAHMS
ncbi:MAG TPA: hypothetical protein VEX67_04585 [Solirubrobacteraceae bacterium]|nr:hypothetical protein [Solirubrobacteraceae bacterium]